MLLKLSSLSLVAFLFSALFSSNALAANNKWMVEYFENKQIVFELFEKAPDGWQDKVGRWTFSDQSKAEHFRKKNLIYFQNIPKISVELKSYSLDAVLWKAEHKWNEDWEKKYSEWIKANNSPTFLADHKVATDCADVVYAYRWIFARIHKLEMANRLGGSGDFFTHKSMRAEWKKYSTSEIWHQDQRFLKALDYLTDNTYTHTLIRDSYPVAINKQSIKPGKYHLDLTDTTGHTQLIHKVQDEEEILLPFFVIQSTVPKQLRTLSETGFWYDRQAVFGKGGILGMRWPDFKAGSVRFIDGKKMPNYSEEQYQENFLREANFPFYKEIYLRLNPELNFENVLLEAYKTLRSLFLERVSIVEEGYKVCAQNKCKPTSKEYDNWSTPSRDKRIGELINQTNQIKNMLFMQSPNFQQIEQFLNEVIVQFNGEGYSLNHLIYSWQSNFYSSDPNDHVSVRWGIEAEAVYLWISKKFKELVLIRSEKIKNKKNDLIVEALALVELRQKMLGYCNSFPEKQCQVFQKQLQNNTININQQSINYIKAFSLVPWLSTKVSENQKDLWGESSENIAWLDKSSFKIFETSHEGWIIAVNYLSEVLVFNVKSEQSILAFKKPKADINGLIKQNAALFQVSGLDFYYKNLGSNYEFTDVLSFKPTHTKVLGSGLMLYSPESGDFAIGQHQSEGWKWLARGKTDFSSTFNINNSENEQALFVPQNNQLMIFDFRNDLAIVNSIATVEINQVQAAYVNSDFLISDTHIFVPSSGQIRRHHLPPFFMHSSYRSGFTFNDSDKSSQFFTISALGEIYLKETFTGFPYVHFDVVAFLSNSMPNGPEFFSVYEDRMEKIQIAQDEKFVLQVIGDYRVSSMGDQNMNVYKNNRLIFQNKGFAKLLTNKFGQVQYLAANDVENSRQLIYKISDLEKPNITLVRSNDLFFDMNFPHIGVYLDSNIWLR